MKFVARRAPSVWERHRRWLPWFQRRKSTATGGMLSRFCWRAPDLTTLPAHRRSLRLECCRLSVRHRRGGPSSQKSGQLSLPNQVSLGDLALQVLAFQSGGRVLTSGNDVAEEIARCVQDANAYYVITFAPPAADGPNEYHALEVKIGQPHLKAQTTAGYYAQPTPKP